MKRKIEQRMDTLEKTPPFWSDQLGEWLTNVRMDGVTLSQEIGTTCVVYCLIYMYLLVMYDSLAYM